MRLVTTCLIALLIALAVTARVDAVVTVGPGSNFTWDGFNGPVVPSGVVPNNLALTANGSTAFARDVLTPPHTIAGLNNGVYGNSNSWIGATSQNIDVYNDASLILNTGFAGIALPAMTNIGSFAFGRSNLGNEFADRTIGNYYVQTTTLASPNATTPDSAWNTIGSINISTANFGDTYRHKFFLTSPLSATGVRVVVPGVGWNGVTGTAIDEIELYSESSGPRFSLLETGGTAGPNNLATRPGATAFAKDVIPGFPDRHRIDNLNDGLYGNWESWIGNSTPSFAGIDLGAPQTINAIAFGRDNGDDNPVENQQFVDRWAGTYTLQYTTVASPDQTTPDAAWVTINTLLYDNSFPDSTPYLRHLWGFQDISGVTGVRVITNPRSIAIDELEVYFLPTVIPEPGAWAIWLLGTFGGFLARRRRR